MVLLCLKEKKKESKKERKLQIFNNTKAEEHEILKFPYMTK